MANCLYKCPTISGSDFESKWESLRRHYGPLPEAMSSGIRYDRYSEDLLYFVEWTTQNGRDSFDSNLFGVWLNWKLSIGTNNYGNLPTRKKDHVGISCVPCPFSEKDDALSQSYWDERSRTWLGYIPTSYVDHGNYYMRVAGRGSVWGWECTSNSCPYFLEMGRRYFHA